MIHHPDGHSGANNAASFGPTAVNWPGLSPLSRLMRLGPVNNVRSAFLGKDLLTTGAEQGRGGARRGHRIHQVFVACGAHSRPTKRIGRRGDVMPASSLPRVAGSDQ